MPFKTATSCLKPYDAPLSRALIGNNTFAGCCLAGPGSGFLGPVRLRAGARFRIEQARRGLPTDPSPKSKRELRQYLVVSSTHRPAHYGLLHLIRQFARGCFRDSRRSSDNERRRRNTTQGGQPLAWRPLSVSGLVRKLTRSTLSVGNIPTCPSTPGSRSPICR
jgi:hypothetical protein